MLFGIWWLKVWSVKMFLWLRGVWVGCVLGSVCSWWCLMWLCVLGSFICLRLSSILWFVCCCGWICWSVWCCLLYSCVVVFCIGCWCFVLVFVYWWVVWFVLVCWFFWVGGFCVSMMAWCCLFVWLDWCCLVRCCVEVCEWCVDWVY